MSEQKEKQYRDWHELLAWEQNEIRDQCAASTYPAFSSIPGFFDQGRWWRDTTTWERESPDQPVAIVVGVAEPYYRLAPLAYPVFSFRSNKGEIFCINPDGSVVLGPAVELDQASREFWSYVLQHTPIHRLLRDATDANEVLMRIAPTAPVTERLNKTLAEIARR